MRAHAAVGTGLLPVLAILLAAPGARAQDPGENPFRGFTERLTLGHTVRTRGAIVLTLRVARAVQPGLEAHVGLQGTPIDILELPGPAGRWHVRLANRSSRALLVPAGEALLTPSGPSRCTDRPVWIAAGTATFVPVVQATVEPPPGPYTTRGRGLTPVELRLIHTGQWPARVQERNRRTGVVPHRADDVGAAYVTPAFQQVLARYRGDLGGLADGKHTVGVIVADDRGPRFAHIETDAERFRQRWPALMESIVLDAALLEVAGGTPRPGDEPELRLLASGLLRELAARPLRRPTFGQGYEYRWNLVNPVGRWDGLALAEGPVSLTLHSEGAGAPAGGVAGGTTGGRGGEDTPTPGVFEGAGRARLTEYEKRLQERRQGLRDRAGAGRLNGVGGAGRAGGGSRAGGGQAGGGGGGLLDR